MLTLFLITPLLATTLCYSKVLKAFCQHQAGVFPSLRHSRGNEARISVQEIRLSRSLFIVFFTFLSCWIPLWVIVVLRRFFIVRMPRNVELLCMFFLYISSSVNPVMYAEMNSLFRKEFRQIILCRSRSLVRCQCASRKNQGVVLRPVASRTHGYKLATEHAGLQDNAPQLLAIRDNY